MSKKKKSSHDKKIEAFIRIKNMMRGTKKPWATLSSIRNSISTELYDGMISYIRSYPLLSNKLFHPEFPDSPKYLKITRPLEETNIRRELKWALAYLLRHFDRLNSFIILSNEFRHALLVDEYSQCAKILDEVENQFGYSLWLIKHRIPFLQMSQGLESQKLYTRKINQLAPTNGIAAYIAHYVSFKSETTISPGRFTNIFAKHLAEIHLPKDLENYIRNHIDAIPSHIDAVTSILRYENVGTVIDYYEALILSLQIVVSYGYDDLFATADLIGKRVLTSVADPRVEMLLFETGRRDPALQEGDRDAVQAFNYFLEGEYLKAIEIAQDSIIKYPENSDLKEIAARALSIIPELRNRFDHPQALRIVSLMSSIIAKDSTMHDDIANLAKFSFSYHSHPWALSIINFLNKEISSHPLDINPRSALVAMSTSSINPFHISAFSQNATKKALIHFAKKVFGECPAISYGEAISGEVYPEPMIDRLIWEERMLLDAEIVLNSNEIDKALTYAKQLVNSESAYYKQRAIRLIAHCLMKQHVDKCIDFVTSIFVGDIKLHIILPIEDTVNLIDKSIRKLLVKDISLPIIYDMYSRYINSKLDNIRAYTYEDFLFVHNVKRPSQLMTLLDSLELNKVIYFMRYVCIESVMDSSPVFSRSSDIAEERMEVCRILKELDEENGDAYETEIKEIRLRLMVQKLRREVEKSKIHVDIESIRKRVAKTMRESFNRYISFLKYDINPEYQTQTKTEPEHLDAEDPKNLFSLSLPKNEMNDLLDTMIIDLRDEFVSSTEHGLDGYLSVRIRHGTLSGQLRSPLEAANLITRRDYTTGNYKANEYWTNRLRIYDDEGITNLNSLLANFSKHFDELVQTMSTEWIQITTEKTSKKNGLFDFTLYKPHLLLSKYITKETTFEQFLDILFTSLTEILSLRLDAIRNFIDGYIKQEVNNLLTSLQSDIDTLMEYYDMGDINNAIRNIRTEMQVALDRIIEWFRLSKSTAHEPFSIEEAVGISVENIQAFAIKFKARIVFKPVDAPQLMLPGKFLPSIVDILFILFENIVRHSRLSDSQEAVINITFKDNFVHFYIENEIGDGIALEAAKNRIAGIKATMTGDKYKQSISTEGGTGFYKIRKIMEHDFKIDSGLEFGFHDDKKFYVEFTLPSREIDR